jgi:hypothetical protein
MEPFKNYLQELADQRRLSTIRFRSVEGAISEIRAHIIDFSTVADRDMIETDAGIHIGLDQIVQVNDRIREDYC